MAMLTEIHRSVLPDGIRLTLDFDGEVTYHQERLENPRRVFFDFGRTAPTEPPDVSLQFDDDVRRKSGWGGIRSTRRAWSSIWTASPATASSRSTSRIGS